MKTAFAFLLLACCSALGNAFLVSEGDSLTYGTGASPVASSNWVSQLNVMRSTVVCSNVAASGDKIILTTISDATNCLASAIATGHSPRTATLLMGINDIAVNSSVADIKTALNSWVSGVKAFDPECEVFVATLFAADLSETLTARRLELNAFIRTNTVWDSIVDLAADSRLTNYADTTYFNADGVHLNNAGYSAVAGLFEQSLAAAGRFSTTYYVSTNGSDSDGGSTTNKPLLTVQKAVDTARSGDSVVISPGDYPENVTVTNASISVSGTSGVAVGGFEANASGFSLSNVDLNGTNVTTFSFALYLGENVASCVFSNISVTGASGGTNSGFGGVGMAGNPSGPTSARFDNVRIENPNYHAFVLTGSGHTVTNCSVTGTTGWDAFRIVGSNIRIVNNWITNFSNTYSNANHSDVFQTLGDNEDESTNVLVEANFVANCDGYQLGNMTDNTPSVGEISNWTFRNNVFANISRTLNLYVPNVSFYNNTFYKAGRDSNWSIIYGATAAGRADNLTLYNNAFVECAGDETRANVGWYGGSDATNVVANYNLVVGASGSAGETKTGFATGGREANGVNGQQPQFADASSLVFSLSSGSSCIGAGTDLSAYFTDDFTGSTRVAPWEIGAYEFTGSVGTTATAGTVNVGTLTIGN